MVNDWIKTSVKLKPIKYKEYLILRSKKELSLRRLLENSIEYEMNKLKQEKNKK